MRIAVDLMGSDSSPQNLFDGVLTACKELNAIESIIAIASKEAIAMIANSQRLLDFPQKIQFIEAEEVVQMDEEPIEAVRKKNSSIQIGLALLKEKKVEGFVSAGNTGALILAATHILKRLPGISRPALLALLPTEKSPLAIIDVGGNLTITAQNLLDFSRMGASFQRHYLGIQKPKVGLLNVGAESHRGTQELRQAYDLLSQDAKAGGCYEFCGNVEGKSAFQGKIDVLVSDGFSGNILLKTAEGVANFLINSLKKREKKDRKISDQNVNLKSLEEEFSSAEYPGAVLCGLDGVVIKCHGDASPRAIFNGIKGAYEILKKQNP